MTNELTLENIRSGAFPSDAHAVGFLLGKVERLQFELKAARAELEIADAHIAAKVTAPEPGACPRCAAVDARTEALKQFPQPDRSLPNDDPPAASRDASPADLVGALQDVVHTDPGPVRAGKAHRDASSEPDKRCQHDLQVEGNTIVVTDEGKRAVCVYCGHVWQMPAQRT